MLLVRQDETRILESNTIIVTYSELWTVMKQRSVNSTCTNNRQIQKIHKSRNATMDAVHG